MKYIAIFDIPDDYGIGCACAKICPKDGKIRTEAEFENAYADVEPLGEDREKVFHNFAEIDRVLSDLGIHNAYDMPSFWCGRDYKVIPTKWHKGYMQALEDVEKEVRKRFGFAERDNIQMMPPFFAEESETESRKETNK